MHRSIKPLIRLCLALFLLGASPASLAVDCAVNFSDINYGLMTGPANSTQDAQGSVDVTCTWGALESLNVGEMRVCVHIGRGGPSYSSNPSGFRKLRNTDQRSKRMAHNLYSDAARTRVWGSNRTDIGSARPVEILINAQGILPTGGSKTETRPIFARAVRPANPRRGVYFGNFANRHAQITYAPSASLSNCDGTAGTRTNGSFRIEAEIQATCTLEVNTVDFGSTSAIDNRLQAQAGITVNCLQGTSWQLGLSEGTAPGASVQNRQLRRAGGSETIAYQLYSNSGRSKVWGNTPGVDTVSGNGKGRDQNYTVYGEVPAQGTPPSGTYRDTIIATIIF